MAAWAVTQTTRFKAAVSGAPVIDMASEFGTENGSAYDEWFYGTPYEKLDGFIKSSPMTFVKNAKTPTLLLQGEDDTTDPIGQSQQFYRGLKRYGVESDLVLYPREPHGLREEKHLLDRLTRILAWYDRYLKPARTAGTPQPLMDTLFHVLVQNSSDAIVMLDAQRRDPVRQRIGERGSAATRSTSGSAAARFENMHPDDIATTRAGFEECLRRPGVPVSGEFRVRHKDGGWLHIESIARQPPRRSHRQRDRRQLPRRHRAAPRRRGAARQRRAPAPHRRARAGPDLLLRRARPLHLREPDRRAGDAVQRGGAARPALLLAGAADYRERRRRVLPAADFREDADDLHGISVGEKGRRDDLGRPACRAGLRTASASTASTRSRATSRGRRTPRISCASRKRATAR